MANLQGKTFFFLGLILLAVAAGPVNAGIGGAPEFNVDEIYNINSGLGTFAVTNVSIFDGEGFAVGASGVTSVGTTRSNWVALDIPEVDWDNNTVLQANFGINQTPQAYFGGAFDDFFGVAATSAVFYADAGNSDAISGSGGFSDQFTYLGDQPLSQFIAFNFVGPNVSPIGTTNVSIIPLPPALALLALPLLGLGLRRRSCGR